MLDCELELVETPVGMAFLEAPILLCNEEEGVGRMALVGAVWDDVVLGIGWRLICQILDKGCCCPQSPPQGRQRVGAKFR